MPTTAYYGRCRRGGQKRLERLFPFTPCAADGPVSRRENRGNRQGRFDATTANASTRLIKSGTNQHTVQCSFTGALPSAASAEEKQENTEEAKGGEKRIPGAVLAIKPTPIMTSRENEREREREKERGSGRGGETAQNRPNNKSLIYLFLSTGKIKISTTIVCGLPQNNGVEHAVMIPLTSISIWQQLCSCSL